MGAFRLTTAPDLEVHLKRSARARRLSLRVSSLDGRVTLTLPPHVPERVARAFAEEKARWIGKALEDVVLPVPVVVGATLPIEDRPHRISSGQGRAARIENGLLHAPQGREGPAIAALLKCMARDRLSEAVAHYSNALGRDASRLTLRDPRGRWGSCSSAGNLMFSWRLVLAPPVVLNYVAAHEVAHLKHMDHSPAFWGAVEDLMPGYATHRDWLRRNGAALHRYRF